MPKLAVAVIEHPLGGIDPDDVVAKARGVLGAVLELLGSRG